MTTYRIGEATDLLGVSVDTPRRWGDAGRLPATRDGNSYRSVNGVDLAAFARSMADEPGPASRPSSARNRVRGIVIAITHDTVMAHR